MADFYKRTKLIINYINRNCDIKILQGTREFRSREGKVIEMYTITLNGLDNDGHSYKEVYKSCSRLCILMYVLDLYTILTGGEFNTSVDKWNKIRSEIRTEGNLGYTVFEQYVKEHENG